MPPTTPGRVPTYGRPVGRGDPAFRRAITFVLMSLVVPGSAHIVAGRRGLGRFVLRTWFALVGVAVLTGLVFVVSPGTLTGLGTNLGAVTVLRWAAIIVGVAWSLVIVHAYKLARPPTIAGRRRVVAGGVALVVSLAIMFPALFAANVLKSQRDLIMAIFPEGTSELGDRVNVLLLGGDAGADREGLRPDSINVASIDVRTGRTILFGLPRNLQHAPFPPGSALAEEFPDGYVCEEDQCLLNGIYTYAIDHPEFFPAGMPDVERGTTAMKDVVGTTLGLPIDFYVMVDLNGFEGIVDALGGIQIRVTERVPIGGNADNPSAPVEGYIEPGVQHLDGHQALWYARSRTDATDYDRMSRQRCVLGAILREADPANVLLNYTQLADSAESTIATDIPRGVLDAMVQLGLRVKGQPLTSVQFVPPLVPSTRNPDIEFIQTTVQESIEASLNASVAPTTEPPVDSTETVPPPVDPGTDDDPESVPTEPVAVDQVCAYE